MSVMICLLRGVNLGGHNKVPMAVLRALCESLKCQDVQTCVQSGNVVFRTSERDPVAVGKKLEKVIEKKLNFQVDVVVRTPSDLRDVVARTGFNKGMCFRLLYTLHQCGFLDKVGENHYRLASEVRRRRLYRIGYAAQGQDTSFDREVRLGLVRAAERDGVAVEEPADLVQAVQDAMWQPVYTDVEDQS